MQKSSFPSRQPESSIALKAHFSELSMFLTCIATMRSAWTSRVGSSRTLEEGGVVSCIPAMHTMSQPRFSLSNLSGCTERTCDMEFVPLHWVSGCSWKPTRLLVRSCDAMWDGAGCLY